MCVCVCGGGGGGGEGGSVVLFFAVPISIPTSDTFFPPLLSACPPVLPRWQVCHTTQSPLPV